MGMQALENIFYEGAMQIAGDPVFIGFLVIIFFGAIVLVQNTRLDGKLVVLIPAMLLAIAFIPAIFLLFALVLAVILYLAFTKLTNR